VELCGLSPPRNLPMVRERCPFLMQRFFSLFDLDALCGDDIKLIKVAESYGVLRDPACE